MLEMVHDSSQGGEYVTVEQAQELVSQYRYVVTGEYLRDISEDYGSEHIAQVLYKGDSESEAKAVWLYDKFCEG